MRRSVMLLLACWMGMASVPHLAGAQVPPPKWPESVSGFCARFLGICHRTCFRTNSKLRDRSGKSYPPRVVSIFCSRRCWKHPARTKLCAMSTEQLLDLAERHERLERQKLRKEQELIRQQKRRETQERQATAQRQRQEQAQLRKRQQELSQQSREQKREVQELRRQLRAQARKMAALRRSKTANEKSEYKRIQEERKRLALQKKLLREEKQRLAAQKRQAAQREREERERRKAEEKRLAELKRLQQERLAELERLKSQRLAEAKRLKRFKRLAAREKRLADKHKRLAAMHKKAASSRQRSLARKLRQEQRELQAQISKLKREKSRLSSARKRYKRTQTKRIKRIKRLRKRAQRRTRRTRRRSKMSRGQKDFNAGKLTDAIAWAKRRDASLAQKLKEFSSVYRHGSRAHQARNPDAAIPDLERALTLDLDIGGSKSVYTKRLRLMLSNMYISKGLLAMSKHYHASAFIYFSVAKRHNPTHYVLKNQLKKLHDIASGHYKQALRFRKSNPAHARKFLRKVVKLVARNTDLYKKARTILDM